MQRRIPRWRMLIPPLIALATTWAPISGATPLGPGLALAGYQGTADSNVTAFSVSCLGWSDPHPARMLAMAVSAMKGLGYTTTGYSRTAFTRAHTMSRTVGDWAYYVHSHGDYYWNATDARRYSGFREDSGDCAQSVIFSKDIAARRAGRATNLVLISTCHNGESNTTLPAAFGIAKDKAGIGDWNGPSFYVGYLGSAFDNDEETFEAIFWDALSHGKGVGAAYDRAMLGDFTHADFDADWWGSYAWSGKAGPGTTCLKCL